MIIFTIGPRGNSEQFAIRKFFLQWFIDEANDVLSITRQVLITTSTQAM